LQSGEALGTQIFHIQKLGGVFAITSRNLMPISLSILITAWVGEMPDSKDTVIAILFAYLLNGYTLNRFQAALLHNFCLPSTVSALQKKYGITISRKYETVRGYMGNPTQCCRYWISKEERQRFIAKQQERKSENPTGQDKESGLSQISPELDE